MPKTTTNKTIKKAELKKPAKKAVAKKVAAKTKSDNKKDLVYAGNINSFWVNDGQILNSLLALHQALAEMEKDIFAHHVTKDKNDFADWVETVLCDSDCAEGLRKSKTPASAYKVVVKHLKTYNV